MSLFHPIVATGAKATASGGMSSTSTLDDQDGPAMSEGQPAQTARGQGAAPARESHGSAIRWSPVRLGPFPAPEFAPELPPNSPLCPKDAKARPYRPGFDQRFLASQSGEGDSNPRYTLPCTTVFETAAFSPRRSPLISIKPMLAGLFRESSTAPNLIQGALGRTWASKWHKNGITELRSRSPIAPSPAPG